MSINLLAHCKMAGRSVTSACRAPSRQLIAWPLFLIRLHVGYKCVQLSMLNIYLIFIFVPFPANMMRSGRQRAPIEYKWFAIHFKHLEFYSESVFAMQTTSKSKQNSKCEKRLYTYIVHTT